MKIQINRHDFIKLNNIFKIVEKRGNLYIYKKSGYPHAIKASCKLPEFLMRIVNAKGDFTGIPIIKE